MRETINIVWFKKDLRVYDHLPLKAACDFGGPVVALYVDEFDMWSQESQSERHRAFAMQCVADLAFQFEKRNCKLNFITGDVINVLSWLQDRYVKLRLWSHEETGNLWSYKRDKELRRWCSIYGVEWKEFPNNGVVRRLKTRDGWADIWNERMSSLITELPDFSKIISVGSTTEVPNPKQSFIQKGGREEAIKTLNDFLLRRGQKYRGGISSPNSAVRACSRLSPYLAWGCLSMRELVSILDGRVAELKLRLPDERKDWMSSLRDFKSRLYWHCHFIQKLEIMPDIESKNIHSAYDGLRENDFDETLYKAWCEGRTGYPFVDACMRYLNKYGWINFRMRAMLVSFATQNLWLHWKPVALHLGRQFTDYEPGIHYSQIQMQAGTTGINAPRIYDPVKQSFDQDPKGIFIRKYVEELKDCEDALIHFPHETEGLFKSCNEYPQPIVDFSSTYKNARAKLGLVRKKAGFKEEAEHIRHLIASRKK